MTLKTLAAVPLAAAVTLMLGASPALARPHHAKHKVCHTEWHHHHRVNVCQWR
jgi:hypothetical protein